MGFKKVDQSIVFAEFALASSMKHNRSLKTMETLASAIDWSRIETILLSHYTIGIAVDARLVKSASRPISNDKIKGFNQKRNTLKGNLDKICKLLKFSRDLESDWVVQYDTPHYGLKEHASVDTNHGFILATTITPSSVNDTNFLSYCTLYSRPTKQTIKKVFADKGYAGKPNRDFSDLNNIQGGIMRKDSTTAKLTAYERKRNKKILKVRYIVEQYFEISHLNDQAKRARFTTITKNKFDCWYRQAAYNISRGLKISM